MALSVVALGGEWSLLVRTLSDKSLIEDVASDNRYGIERRPGLRRAVLCEQFLDLLADFRRIPRFRRTTAWPVRCSFSPFDPASPAGRNQRTELPRRRRASIRPASTRRSVTKREIRTNAIGKSKTPARSQTPAMDASRMTSETGCTMAAARLSERWSSAITSCPSPRRRFETRRLEPRVFSIRSEGRNREYLERNANGTDRKHEVKVLTIPRPGGRVQRDGLARRPPGYVRVSVSVVSIYDHGSFS